MNTKRAMIIVITFWIIAFALVIMTALSAHAVEPYSGVLVQTASEVAQGLNLNLSLEFLPEGFTLSPETLAPLKINWINNPVNSARDLEFVIIVIDVDPLRPLSSGGYLFTPKTDVIGGGGSP